MDTTTAKQPLNGQQVTGEQITQERQKGVAEDKKPQKKITTLSKEELKGVINKISTASSAQDEKDDVITLRVTGESPIITLVNNILLKAAEECASDIHIEPTDKNLRIRYRVDGVLRPTKDIDDLKSSMKVSLVSRIKILSRLDIAEKRLPQDGRIKLKYDGGEMDFRVSTLPTIYGEKVVMRLLDKSNLQLDLKLLGFDDNQLTDFEESIEKPYGMILVTGPTGSGKTTTLYSGLSRLNKPGVNIMTAEDPVEYNLSGVNQVQINHDIGLNFASTLRSFLRQDPDVIMVGEIRDFDTAEIAVKAALTGHLVLSTLHTNDAPSTITRLINMGIEPFLVSSAVVLVVAQRLARKICKDCKTEHKISEKQLLKIGFSEEDIKSNKWYKGAGCPTCNNTGYKGRIALYEIMTLNDELKDVIMDGGTAEDIKKDAIKHGMLTLRQSGINKVKEGLITVDEVLRCTFGD
ncbi:type IV-A pilus assembly ATPase PilB [Candidatus Magnetobacterium bavaricum]|uniref:Type IV-A pilus assembly ATPase PilB n=1 Tax=Candidatus Magnetobacterium bavaricum TaxID=29290 RepID=A0A0F3GPK8_9BACT|nr:type IV-A pilus assembly ATPase PilB [Candidatus Magnetobacterium bavaricum]